MSNDPYADIRWVPQIGEGLSFDAHYRVAHLPLVSPDHPRALGHLSGRDYRDGRYDRARISIVADLGRPFLEQHPCRSLLHRLAASSFADKVAFDLVESRAPNLHCTLVGDVGPSAVLRDTASRILSEAPMLEPIMHGPFIGRFNRGRIYFPLEFDRASDRKMLEAVSAVFARDRQRFTAAGLVNLRDELDPHEAGELAAILSELQEARARLAIPELSWTSTHDDLTLDMQRLETITLSTKERSHGKQLRRPDPPRSQIRH